MFMPTEPFLPSAILFPKIIATELKLQRAGDLHNLVSLIVIYVSHDPIVKGRIICQ
jgi:hypothetical protein